MESANEKLEKKAVFSPYYGDKKLRPNGGAIHFYLLGHQQVSGKNIILFCNIIIVIFCIISTLPFWLYRPLCIAVFFPFYGGTFLRFDIFRFNIRNNSIL